MSYPFFDCTSCSNRVQNAWFCLPGSLPLYLDRDSKLSTAFDDESQFSHNCRGQGSHYNTRRETPVLYCFNGFAAHYNFTGSYSGNCCFCVLHLGFPPGIFARNGCCNCLRKESLRCEFAKLTRRPDSAAVGSWLSHGWSALPSVIIDHILLFVVGLEDCPDKVTVRDGRVLVLN